MIKESQKGSRTYTYWTDLREGGMTRCRGECPKDEGRGQGCRLWLLSDNML